MNSPSFLVFNVVMLLGVVLPVIAVNTVILVALVLESFIVNVIRLVLGNILVFCLITALGLAMYQIAGIVPYLLPVNNPPTAPCTVTIFLIAFEGTARLVFMATFAIVVFILIKHGAVPKKCFVITSIIAVVVLWIMVFLGSSPLFSHAIINTRYLGSLSCSFTAIATSYIYLGLYVFFFGLIALSVTITLLVIIVCCIKSLSDQDFKLEKSTVKFGFILLLSNGINMLGQIAPHLIVLLWPASPGGHLADLTYTSHTFLNAALIPTPILVPIFFKPIRKRLQHWLCCCVPRKRMDKHS